VPGPANIQSYSADRVDPQAVVEANTTISALPLCPEIRLRLLKEDAPLRQTATAGLFADAGPRPYWAFCWASGQALARYLLDHPHAVRGRRILDFGSGSGIAAIAAAKAGAASVTALEVDPLARTAIALNARLNRIAITISDSNLPDVASQAWDVLVAGDVCYLAQNYQCLRRLADEGREVLLADPGRPGLEPGRLEELARFALRTIPELEDPDLKEAAVYRFRGPG